MLKPTMSDNIHSISAIMLKSKIKNKAQWAEPSNFNSHLALFSLQKELCCKKHLTGAPRTHHQ